MNDDSYKAELISRLSSLPTARLQKLLDYSDLLVIPDEDLLIDVTQSQMVEKAHRLADSLFPEWTDRSKADFGEFLIELFALFSEKDFWYINAFANENIFRKTRSYSNAYMRAVTMGYTPKTCKGGNITFAVTFKPGNALTYHRGDIVIGVGDYKFSNDSDFSVSQSSGNVVMNLSLFEGTQEIEDIPYNGYSVYVRRKNVDLDSVAVSVGGVNYDRVNNFCNSDSDSHHFMILPEEDGACAIFFGKNGFGVQPAMNDLVHVEYRRCSGKLALPEVLDAEVKDSISEREAESAVFVAIVNNNDGQDSESLDSIIETAPTYFQNRGSIINKKSALEALRKFTFVNKIAIEIYGGSLNYFVIPNRYGVWNINDTEKGILQSEFEPYLAVGYQASCKEVDADCRINFIKKESQLLLGSYSTSAKITIRVLAYKGYSLSVIENGVRATFLSFCNPWLKGDFGAEFNRNNLDLNIRAQVDGVQSVSFFLNNNEIMTPLVDFKLNETEILDIFEESKLEVISSYAF